eukprot:150886_1
MAMNKYKKHILKVQYEQYMTTMNYQIRQSIRNETPRIPIISNPLPTQPKVLFPTLPYPHARHAQSPGSAPTKPPMKQRRTAPIKPPLPIKRLNTPAHKHPVVHFRTCVFSDPYYQVAIYLEKRKKLKRKRSKSLPSLPNHLPKQSYPSSSQPQTPTPSPIQSPLVDQSSPSPPPQPHPSPLAPLVAQPPPSPTVPIQSPRVDQSSPPPIQSPLIVPDTYQGEDIDKLLSVHTDIWALGVQLFLALNAPANGPTDDAIEDCELDLYITRYDSQNITMTASPNMTIRDLKLKLYDVSGIKITAQRLLFAGKQLENKYTLAYYNIRNESTLDLVLSLKGGMLQPKKRRK